VTRYAATTAVPVERSRGEIVGEWVTPQLVEVYANGVMPGTLRLALPEKANA